METAEKKVQVIKELTEEQIRDIFAGIGAGDTLRALRGISDADMEAIYSIGVNLYTAGNYEDAGKIFLFLVMFEHTSSRYWTALGSLRQAERKYFEAIEAYKFASALDVTNPRPIYYSAECNLALGQKEEALGALDALKEFTDAATETGRKFLEKGKALAALIEGN